MTCTRRPAALPDTAFRTAYPLRLGTTSFVFPAGYRQNVRLLAPLVDDIELLVFQAPPEGRLEGGLVDELGRLARQHDLTYSIHLPLDLELAAAATGTRKASAALAAALVNQTAQLPVSGFVVHVNGPQQQPTASSLRRWQAQAADGLGRLLDRCRLAPQAIWVENLHYRFEWIAPVVQRLGLGICLDVGHAVSGGGDDPGRLLDQYAAQACAFHLYGPAGKSRHGCLELLAAPIRRQVADVLLDVSGPVTLEVFCWQDLVGSLACLAKELKAAAARRAAKEAMP